MSQPDPIPIFLFTYNINKQPINELLFSDKLIEELPSKISSLYCFSLQEFCSILDGCFHNNANKILIRFNTFLLSLLNDKYGVNFQTISMDHIGATGLILISPFPFKFQNIRIGKSAIGYGNSSMKGGIGIRITYFPTGKYDKQSTEITILSCHLNAYEGEYYYELRKQNLNTIIRSIDFGDNYSLIKPNNHIFIMGDLNFRTTTNFKSNSIECRKLLSLNDSRLDNNKEEDVVQLKQEYDELTKALQQGELLIGFTEYEIKFQPTYKYHLNTLIYNSKRSPSWCDRILYLNTYEDDNYDDYNNHITLKFPNKSKDDNQVSQYLPNVNKYSSIESILLSDHKPVFLDITIPFNPPKLIIHELSGCLQILPSNAINNDEGFYNVKSLKNLSSKVDMVSGPTTIYLKQTSLDYLIQNINRPISDWFIGYCLWFTTTQNGRLLLFFFLLICWSIWYFSGFN